MELRKGFIGLLAQAAIFLIFLVGTVNAGCIGDITGIDYRCGNTVIECCAFNENMNCTTKYGLIIGAEGITIDGHGYIMTGPAWRGDSEGIHNDGYNNVTVKNLDIERVNFGIYFKDANNCNIANSTINYDVGSGIWLFTSSYNSIIGNEVNYGQEGHGILLSDSATGNIVEHNTIMTVNSMGICTHESSENEFYHNIVCGNARGDIVIESGHGNRGDNNTCNISKNYSDVSGSPCTHKCSLKSMIIKPSEEYDATTCEQPECGCVSGKSSKIFGCGDVVTESGIFNCNLTCPAAGHGLIVGADDITIDGNGYVLDGVEPGSCDGFGVQRSGIHNPGHDNVVITDLEIKNFCNGIYLKGDEITGNIVANNTVTNCDIHHNGNNIRETTTHGIKLKYVSHSTISNNQIHDNTGRGTGCENGGNGIFLYGGDYNLVFNNTVYDNTKAGIFTKMKSRYNNISNNEVTGNGQGGILLRCKCSGSSKIEHNLAVDNKGPGIYVGGPDNMLRFNTVTNNRNGSIYRNDASVADGIRISREAYNTSLISNDVSGNDNVDIYVREELTAMGYNNTYQTFMNYEDTSEYEDEEVKGKRMVVREEIIKLEKQGIELPPVKVTPLMAALIVLTALAFMLYGYLRSKR